MRISCLMRFVDRAATSEAVPLQSWALIHVAIGDYEKAMEYLQLAAQEVEDGYKSSGNRIIAMNRYRDPVLETPEFIEVRQRLGYYVANTR